MFEPVFQSNRSQIGNKNVERETPESVREVFDSEYEITLIGQMLSANRLSGNLCSDGQKGGSNESFRLCKYRCSKVQVCAAARISAGREFGQCLREGGLYFIDITSRQGAVFQNRTQT